MPWVVGFGRVRSQIQGDEFAVGHGGALIFNGVFKIDNGHGTSTETEALKSGG